ncbi:MAG: diguanylate cyclase [Candidatus Buchananbacteria bacterium]|nr:diguanylate cyclase [Candidatus Buchananbacteria bacterium]
MNKAEQELIQPEQDKTPEQQIEELKQKNKELKDRLKEAITDPVTGLERRAGLFQDINQEITEMMGEKGLKKLEELTDNELIEFIDQLLNNETIKKQPLNIAICDVAYLSLANKSGLQGGDQLLGRIGDAARAVGSPKVTLPEDLNESEKKPIVKFFRHGGDELTAIVREWPQEAEQKLQKFAQQVSKIKNIKDFEEANLSTHIDYGLAHITEALTAFKKIMETKEGPKDIPPSARLKNLENIWLEIAELKATIEKTKIRLKLLAELKTKQPELYDKVIAYLRKGAHNITEKKLNELIEQADQKFSGEKWDDITSEFIIQELKNEKALDEQSQINLETILKSE